MGKIFICTVDRIAPSFYVNLSNSLLNRLAIRSNGIVWVGSQSCFD